MYRFLGILFLLAPMVWFSSCDLDETPNSVPGYTDDLCFHNAMENGIVFRLDGKIWLRGGDDSDQHFDITGWTLRPCQLNLQLGREYYPALIEPAYVSVSDHTGDFSPDEEVILLETGGKPKVFPFQVLNNHILINDEVDGTPVMVTYSILSERAAVYRRDYCDTTFTFAVSGYSYWDYNVENAKSDFLLWDRETESLWWPLIRKGVSGAMQGSWLVAYDESKWRLTTWQDVVMNHPDASLLEQSQTMMAPLSGNQDFDLKCQ